MRFRVCAINEKGYTFQFFYYAFNWYKCENRANNELNKIVKKDSFHQKNGPWTIKYIDIG